ncbi:MAG: PAS domain S-box protein [Scytonematopsis contorta HA4267-MV1]|jgi:PAS domain S-box-containing protein|nr:PAS domain S-box protein [Scytonematopsis contorta HA4267-MV1]
MNRLSEKIVAGGFGFAILLLGGTTAASYVSIQQLREDKQWVMHTYQVLATLDEINIRLSVNEIARRDLMITNKYQYLQASEQEQTKIYAALKTIRYLTKDNQSQQHRLDTLEHFVNQRLAIYSQSLQKLKQNQQDIASLISVTDESMKISQKIKPIIDAMNNEEESLLRQRTAQTDKSVKQVIIFLLIGSSWGLVILVLVYYLLRRQIFINQVLSENTINLEKQAARAKLVDFLESTTDAFVALDSNWKYTYVNQKAGQIFNRNPENLIGKNIWEEFPEGVGQKFYHAYHQAINYQELIKIEEYYPPWERWYENRIYPSREGLSIFFQDITPRKRAELALKAQEERWQLAIDGSNDGIWDYDLQTHQIFLSPRCFEILGYGGNEIETFDKWVSLVHPEDKQKLQQAFEAHLNHQTSRYSCEYRMHCKDESYKWLLSRGQALWDEQGVPIRAVGSVTDITDRKLAQFALQQAKQDLEIKVKERTAQLQQSLEELERSNKELENFAHIASHDLQEPLRAITAYTHLLKEEYSSNFDADAQEYMSFITDGAARMRQLIQDLLSYSRVNKRELILTSVDCNFIINQVINNLKVSIAESHATITYDSLPTVNADRNQLVQLFQNLISNAIKFRGSEEPKIHICALVSTQELKNCWLFSVRDNGIGIKSQYLERIFEIFRRLHTYDELPGTGIGLAICKKIVEHHDGRIWAKSEFGSGTTFYFTLC